MDVVERGRFVNKGNGAVDDHAQYHAGGVDHAVSLESVVLNRRGERTGLTRVMRCDQRPRRSMLGDSRVPARLSLPRVSWTLSRLSL
ncbi:hypothetical protein ACFY9F_35730 [Streptomyces sp. NPDC012421]|uniref:hypothetical protein n=1 Tax=Streptomyces sp. NPDC012421 TaxID=3364832 RepID=UPI0036E22CEC